MKRNKVIRKSQVSYTLNPSVASFKMDRHFVILSVRIGEVDNELIGFTKEILKDIELLQNRISNKEFIKLRGIYYDDKNGAFNIFIDLIHDREILSSLTKENIQEFILSRHIKMVGNIKFQKIMNININLRSEHTNSDHFSPNHKEYYEEIKKELLV